MSCQNSGLEGPRYKIVLYNVELGKAYPFLALHYLSSPSRFPGQLFDALLLSSDPVAVSCPSESLAQAWGRGEGSQGNCALGRRPSGH